MTMTYTPEQIATNRRRLAARVALRTMRAQARNRQALRARYAARLAREAREAREASYSVSPPVLPAYVATGDVETMAREAREARDARTARKPLTLTITREARKPLVPKLTSLHRNRTAREIIAAIRCGEARLRVAREDASIGLQARSKRVAAAMARAIASGAVQAVPESHVAPTATYDPAPYRGLVNAREARYSPRGSSGIKGVRGYAERVSIRDAHYVPETLAPLNVVGIATHPDATDDNYNALISTVRRTPSLCTLRRITADRQEMIVPVNLYREVRETRKRRENRETPNPSTYRDPDVLRLAGIVGYAPELAEAS